MRSLFIKVIVFFIPLFLAFLYSVYMGESLPMQIVAALQADKLPILYYPKYIYAQLEYFARLKVDIIERTEPNVVVVGTSRSVGFQAPMFTTDFYNASFMGFEAAMNDRLIREIEPDKLPEIILLEVSNFWFQSMEDRLPFEIPAYGDIPLDHVLVGGTVLSFANTVSSLQEINFAPVRDGWYLMGMNTHRENFNLGIRPDGSVYRGTLELVEKTMRDRMTGSIEALSLRQTPPFQLESLEPEERAFIEDLLAYAASHDVTVIGFMPPYEPLYYNVMRLSGDYDYFDDIAAELDALFEQYGGDFVNFTDPGSFDVGTLDFFDGWHMSERMSLQTIIRIAEHTPHILGNHVDLDQLTIQLETVQNPYNLYYADESQPLEEFTSFFIPTLQQPQTEKEAMLLLLDRALQFVPGEAALYDIREQLDPE